MKLLISFFLFALAATSLGKPTAKPNKGEINFVNEISPEILAYLTNPDVLSDIAEDVHADEVRYTQIDFIDFKPSIFFGDNSDIVRALVNLESTDPDAPLRSPYDRTVELLVSVRNGEPEFRGIARDDVELEREGRWNNQVYDAPVTDPETLLVVPW